MPLLFWLPQQKGQLEGEKKYNGECIFFSIYMFLIMENCVIFFCSFQYKEENFLGILRKEGLP